MCSVAHVSRLPMSGSRLLPLSDNEYSTRGGTSGKATRLINPSASSIFNVAVSIFCEMSGMLRCNSLKRRLPFVSKVKSTNIDHLSPTRDSIFRTGQLGKSASRTSVLFMLIGLLSCITAQK